MGKRTLVGVLGAGLLLGCSGDGKDRASDVAPDVFVEGVGIVTGVIVNPVITGPVDCDEVRFDFAFEDGRNVALCVEEATRHKTKVVENLFGDDEVSYYVRGRLKRDKKGDRVLVGPIKRSKRSPKLSSLYDIERIKVYDRDNPKHLDGVARVSDYFGSGQSITEGCDDGLNLMKFYFDGKIRIVCLTDEQYSAIYNADRVHVVAESAGNDGILGIPLYRAEQLTPILDDEDSLPKRGVQER